MKNQSRSGAWVSFWTIGLWQDTFQKVVTFWNVKSFVELNLLENDYHIDTVRRPKVERNAMDFKDMDISPELREKAKACTSPEELIELAKEQGYKLSDQDLEAVAGGAWADFHQSSCDNYQGHGDARVSIDPAHANSDFVNGIVDGGELD